MGIHFDINVVTILNGILIEAFVLRAIKKIKGIRKAMSKDEKKYFNSNTKMKTGKVLQQLN